MRSRRGFTLIEILIVLTVIGVLAGVAYVEYTAQKRSSEYKSMRASVYSLVHAVKNRFYAGQGLTASANTGQTNTRYMTNIVESTFGDYEVRLVGSSFQIRVRYWRQGATSGATTATYLFDDHGDQISCAGADCMSG